MTIATIWAGATNASDVLLLIAAVIAAVDAVVLAIRGAPEAALLPVAVGLVALGLLALSARRRRGSDAGADSTADPLGTPAPEGSARGASPTGPPTPRATPAPRR